jgi:sulfide:quinone oxidoreductase
VLKDINVQFHNAGGVLFGVAHFVPTLEGYMERYGADLRFSSTLTAVDGQARVAQFKNVQADGSVEMQEVSFDFLHFVPPQKAPAFIAESPLADEAGWLAVDPETLAHPQYGNVFGAGDVVGTSNAKTMAAARKHAPTVAENLLAALDGRPLPMAYDGYGACPLTVEAGRVVLAEFGYGGKLLPTFPIEPAVPRLSQWILKRHLMPYIYWDLMLKGHELFAQPERRIA